MKRQENLFNDYNMIEKSCQHFCDLKFFFVCSKNFMWKMMLKCILLFHSVHDWWFWENIAMTTIIFVIIPKNNSIYFGKLYYFIHCGDVMMVVVVVAVMIKIDLKCQKWRFIKVFSLHLWCENVPIELAQLDCINNV